MKQSNLRAIAVGLLLVVLVCFGAFVPHSSASVRGLYVGGDFYASNLASHPELISNARISGYTRLFLFTLHILDDGSIRYNDVLIVTNGVYVGDTTWAAKLASCKVAPTSVDRIEATIGCWGTTSFNAIKSLLASQGTNTSSILYRNFLALKNATGIDAIQYDDETTYDSASSITFGKMLNSMGMKVTLCPYTAQSYWVAVKAGLGTNCDAVYLQCYDGGAGNDPGGWINALGGFKVYPGLWGNTDSTNSATAKFRGWVNSYGITGGFMWLNGNFQWDWAIWPAAMKLGLDPAPPTNLVAVAGQGVIALSWNAVAGAKSYVVKRSTSPVGTYTVIATNINTSFYNTGLSSGARWYYKIGSIAEGDAGLDSTYVTALTTSLMPTGWTNIDIGVTGTAGISGGATSNNTNTIVLQGGGSGVGGTADSFSFSSIAATNNAAIMARCVAFQATDSGAIAGLMFRNDATTSSMNVGLFLSSTNTLCMDSRNATGGTTVYTTPLTGISTPVYLQLLRNGSVFTGYYSTDGMNWKLVSSVSVGLNSTLLSGVAVCAHAASGLATAAFDTLTGGQPVVMTKPTPASSIRYVGGNFTLSAGINAASPVYYQWMRSGTPVPNSTNATLVLSGLSLTDSGSYSVIVTNAFGTINSSSASLTVLTTASFAYAQKVISDHPISYWRFNESGGTVASDYISGNDGVYTNVQLNQLGYSFLDANKSVRFGTNNPTDCFARVPVIDFGTSGNAAFSVEAWVNGGAQTNDCGLITKGTGAGGEQFNLDCGGTSHGFRFFVRDAGGTARLASSSVTPGSVWHHLVGVCDEANGQILLYVDGTNAASGTIAAGSGLKATSNLMTIGSRQSGSATAYDQQFIGRMQDVAVYGSALSSAKIKAHFAMVTNRPPVFSTNIIAMPNAEVGKFYFAYGNTLAVDPNSGDTNYFAKLSASNWLAVASFGYLSGTPGNSDVGTNLVPVSVRDQLGASNTATLVVIVNGFTTNSIFLNPATVGHSYSGSLKSFLFDVNPGPVAFQMVSGPSWLNLDASGVLSGVPTASDLGLGVYQVSATDPSGLTQSAQVNLTVAPALVLSPISVGSGGTLSFGWSGGVGPYQLQWATNLVDPVWQNLGAPVGSNGSFSVTPTSSASFYRVVGQ